MYFNTLNGAKQYLSLTSGKKQSQEERVALKCCHEVNAVRTGGGARHESQTSSGAVVYVHKSSAAKYNMCGEVGETDFLTWKRYPHICYSQKRDLQDTCKN